MKNTNKLLVFSFLLAFGVEGCGQGGGSAQKPEAAAVAADGAKSGATESKNAAASDGESADENGKKDDGNPSSVRFTPPGSAPTPVNRLLVYHADIRLKVNNLALTSKRLDTLVQRSGGYLSAATETREDGELRQEMTLRLPPARFQATLQVLALLGSVEHKNLTTDDVTAEHADVAARLGTKRAVEQRYVALLAKAQKITDILAIEKQIAEVREEIESTESRLKSLNDEVAYSTVTLLCYQPISQSVPDAPVVSLGSRLVTGFYDGWELLTSLFVGLVAVWPLLLLGSAVWWAVRRYRAKRRVSVLPPATPQT